MAKTKLGFAVCVGALDERFSSLRLYETGWRFPPAATPYEIGQRWDMDLQLRPGAEPPHMEDALVTRRKLIDAIPNLKAYLMERIAPWTGNMTGLFEGKLGFTASGRGYVQRPNIPTRSTWFWLPDVELVSNINGKGKVYYRYRESNEISYVGVAPPIQKIPTGTLVRVSLARWWKPPDADKDFPERCYLQLSGWYS